MGPRSSKTREDHFSLFSDLKFTSVKISNNALNFLLAQYRAIFKRAYIKGIASAVILTAGLAAGQAQAQPDGTFYENTGSWSEKTRLTAPQQSLVTTLMLIVTMVRYPVAT